MFNGINLKFNRLTLLGLFVLIVIISLGVGLYFIQNKNHNEQKRVNITTKDQEFTNPIVKQRADPWVYRHTDGYYYFTASVPEYDRIEIRRAKTLQELGTVQAKTIWTKHDSGSMSKNIWAPEIHFIKGKWYIYFAAARTDAAFDHRVYVLENSSANPMDGNWTEKGQIKMDWESFTLDATTFEHKGTQYLLWAQKDPKIRGNSNLYISAMSDPWTISGKQIMLSKPEYDWEKVGFMVNEGPAVIEKNGRVFISYSASATDYHYCMGLLTAADSSDPLDPKSWSKSDKPVFETSEENGQYGPGHSCFTVSPDGKQDILVYHARSYKDIQGDPLYDPNRNTRAQVLNWNNDGTPNFGGACTGWKMMKERVSNMFKSVNKRFAAILSLVIIIVVLSVLLFTKFAPSTAPALDSKSSNQTTPELDLYNMKWNLSGDIGVHDPVIARQGSKWYIFYTGVGHIANKALILGQ